jgi:DNA/RNA endonuclease YhcR with UshA esterase domain
MIWGSVWASVVTACKTGVITREEVQDAERNEGEGMVSRWLPQKLTVWVEEANVIGGEHVNFVIINNMLGLAEK